MNDLTTDQLVTIIRALEELAKSSLYVRLRSGYATLDYVIGKENKDLRDAVTLTAIIKDELERRAKT